MQYQQKKILNIIILLTCLFILTQFIFTAINLFVMNLPYMYVLHDLGLVITTLLLPLSGFFLAHIIIYSLYAYLLWISTISIGELFQLSLPQTKTIAIALWVVSVLTILTANTVYVTHSFFTLLIQHNLLNDHVTDSQWRDIFLVLLSVCLSAALITVLSIIRQFSRKMNEKRNMIALSVAVVMLLMFFLPDHHTKVNQSMATLRKPNIILIGFDALRPDYLDASHTPEFSRFFASSIVFNDAHTPLARTLPSLTSLLTAKYPLYHHAREDNVDVTKVDVSQTLAKTLKDQGYETFYASDDNRFSNIHREFGFDNLIGDRGDIKDYLFNEINDYPLSNLIVPTAAGKLLFPYNHANHAAAYTHDPANFIALIDQALSKSSGQPLFLQIHLNVTAWPFYRFNDHQSYNERSTELYKSSVAAADKTLTQLLDRLYQQGLLTHAIVIILSDHGMTLAVKGERVTTIAKYQGNPDQIHLYRTKYNTGKYTQFPDNVSKNGDETTITFKSSFIPPMLDSNNYGIDTSYGYGSDLLSPLQNRIVLAVKGYGISLGSPHQVNGRAMITDIAPTLLDVLGLPAMQHIDGLSLKPYLYNPAKSLPDERPILMESGYSTPEIKQDGIVVDRVIARSINLFTVNTSTGLVNMQDSAMQISVNNKQRAILQGDWLLAYYPAAVRYKMLATGKVMSYVAEPYAVLVNLKTGKWTTELDQPFAHTANLTALTQQLHAFYGAEMSNYLPSTGKTTT